MGREDDELVAPVAARLEEARTRRSTAKTDLDALTARSLAGEHLVGEINGALRQYQRADDAVHQLEGEDRVARGLDRDAPRPPRTMYGPPVPRRPPPVVARPPEPPASAAAPRPGWLARFFGRK